MHKSSDLWMPKEQARSRILDRPRDVQQRQATSKTCNKLVKNVRRSDADLINRAALGKVR